VSNMLIGIAVLASLFVLARIVGKRRGRMYADRKKAFEERLRKIGNETREQALSAGVATQMRPVAVAVRELLEFAGNPPGFALLEEGVTVRVQTPAGEIRIDFGLPRIPAVRPRRPGRPLGIWRISGPGAAQKECLELVDVVVCLKSLIPSGQHILHGEIAESPPQ